MPIPQLEIRSVAGIYVTCDRERQHQHSKQRDVPRPNKPRQKQRKPPKGFVEVVPVNDEPIFLWGVEEEFFESAHASLILAEREGFEPPKTLRPYWFSRPAHSTTLAPLRALRAYRSRIFGSIRKSADCVSVHLLIYFLCRLTNLFPTSGVNMNPVYAKPSAFPAIVSSAVSRCLGH